MDFAEKLRKAKNELLELDSSCKIGELYFIHKFLSSLSPSFDIFRATFSQTHSLLPIKAAGGIASTAAEHSTNSYGSRKRRLKQQESEAAKSILISSSHPPVGNQTTITVPYCTHCKKNYHSVDDRWVLHPDLKKANDKKRGGTQSNGKGKRPRPPPSDTEDDTYNFGGISVYLMATKLPPHLGNL